MFNRKNYLGFMLSFLFILAVAVPAFAASDYATHLITLQIGNKTVEIATRDQPQALIRDLDLNTSPVVLSGKTMVPIRGVLEPFGCEIIWHPGTFRQIEINKGDSKIFMTIGSKLARVNDKDVTLEVAPKILNGSTVIPLRFVGESLGLAVQWLADTREIKLYDGNLDGLGVTPYRAPGKEAGTFACLAETDSNVVAVKQAVQDYEQAYRTFDAGSFNVAAVKAAMTTEFASNKEANLAETAKMMQQYDYASTLKKADVKGIMFDAALTKARVGVETSFVVQAINDEGAVALNVKPGQVLTQRVLVEMILSGKEWKVSGYSLLQ